MSIFFACSKDEEGDNSWQEIPKDIPAENVTLKLNGETPEGATAKIELKSLETGVVTLTNVISGYETVTVDVKTTKLDDGSFDFQGTANVAATKAEATTDLGITINVNGNVSKAGKMTIAVITSGWGTVTGIYSGDSLKASYNGVENNKFTVTLTAVSETKATLLFEKIPNVANDFVAEVTLTKDGENYKLEGSTEKEAGYMINISGNVTKNVLTLTVTTSGYATISKSYYASSETLTYNGAEASSFSASVAIKAISETVATISINGFVPGAESIKIENAVLSEKDNVYTVSGSAKTDEYEISFTGTISEDRKMNGAVTYKLLSPIVGKWGAKIGQGDVAESIFNFTSKEGKVQFPAEIIAMLPTELQNIIKEEMSDNELVPAVKGLLGNYVKYLNYIEFTEGGGLNIAYTEIGKTDVQKLEGLLNYYIKDGQVYLVPDLSKLMGMMSVRTKAAWDPSTILTDGIPLDFKLENNVLNIYLNREVTVGTLQFVNGLLPILGGLLGDKAELVTTIFTTVNSIVNESTTFEAGLVLEKK